MSKSGRLVACLDMAGCPTRCKHCWLGSAPNGHMAADDLRYLLRRFGHTPTIWRC